VVTVKQYAFYTDIKNRGLSKLVKVLSNNRSNEWGLQVVLAVSAFTGIQWL